MSLLRLLGLRSPEVVAVVGAGGKTTLVYRIAAEARGLGRRVLVTTTTHMGTPPEGAAGRVFVEAEGDGAFGLGRALEEDGMATLLGRRVRSDKLEGIPKERVDELAGLADLVLVEADGARGRSLKVPAPHEPVVPASTTLVVVVTALDALGARLDEERVHRVERVAAAAGKGIGETLDEADLAACLSEEGGYVSRVPPGARLAAFLNKAEDEGAIRAATRIAGRLPQTYRLVVTGRARDGWGRVLRDADGPRDDDGPRLLS